MESFFTNTKLKEIQDYSELPMHIGELIAIEIGAEITVGVLLANEKKQFSIDTSITLLTDRPQVAIKRDTREFTLRMPIPDRGLTRAFVVTPSFKVEIKEYLFRNNFIFYENVQDFIERFLQ